MKTSTVLKQQQFEDSGSDKRKPKRSKPQRLDECDNEEKNGLDEDEDEIEDTRYALLLCVFFFPLPQKVSNRPSDLDEGTRSLNHLVCISKICYLRSAKFALEFPDRRGLKTQKKIYTSRLREELESHSAFTVSTASGTTKYRCPIRECWESHLPSNHYQNLGTQLCANQQQGSGSHLATIISSLFTNASKISKVILLPIKAPITGHFL